MKLFDKLRDLFTDDVQEDEEVLLEDNNKDLYQEPKDALPKVMRENIKEEENKSVSKKEIFNFEEVEGRKEEKKKEEVKPSVEEAPLRSFDFKSEYAKEVPSRNSKNVNNVVNTNPKPENTNLKPFNLNSAEEASKKVSELYSKRDDGLKSKFRATPVISPVYGILDKNYKKEEVKEKNEDKFEMKRPSKKVDFETVRKKAFGNLVDDIKDINLCENCELYKEVKRINSLSEDDLLYDMTVDDNKEVTIEKAYDNYEEFGVAYEPKIVHTDVNPTEIVVTSEEKKDTIVIKNSDVNNDDNSNVSTVNINVNNVQSDTKEEAVPSRVDKLENKKEEKKNIADADFFELIDSMYKERPDE